MQSLGSNSSESSVKFIRHSSYPEYASLLCDFGSFYMWWVNCNTRQDRDTVVAPFPSGITVNHLYFVASNPPRDTENSTSMMRTNIEPTEFTTSSSINLTCSVGITSFNINIRRKATGIVCYMGMDSAIVSLQFVIT